MSLPENEFNFLREIVANRISDERFLELSTGPTPKIVDPRLRSQYYEISLDAPARAFGGAVSKKTIAQAVKKRLIERKLIELIDGGGPTKRAVVRFERSFEKLAEKQPRPEQRLVKRGRPPKSRPLVAVAEEQLPDAKPTITDARAILNRDFDEFMGALAVVRRYPDFIARLGIHIPEGI